VVIGHARRRAAATDYLDQEFPVERGLAQGQGGAAVAAATAAMPFVAADAIR
jgi:hypothetical protein